MNRRVATIDISYSLLAEWLKGHPMSEVGTDLPKDLDIESILPLEQPFSPPFTFRVLVTSATFGEVPEGEIPPHLTPTMTKRISEHDVLAAAMTRCPDCPDCTGPEHFDAVRGIVR